MWRDCYKLPDGWIPAQGKEDFRHHELASADCVGAASISRGYGRGRGRGQGGGRFGSNNFSGGYGSGGYTSVDKSYGRSRCRLDGKCRYFHKNGHMWRDCYKLPDGWIPAQGKQSRGAGRGRGRGRGSRNGHGGGAANMKSEGNESESRDDRISGQFFYVSTQAPDDPEKDEGFEKPTAVGKVTLHSLDYWVIDSGGTYSMTPRADLLTKLEPSPVKHVTSALGQRAEVKGMGKAMFKGADGKMVGLKNVLWVPNLAANLISVRRLQKAGMNTSSKGAKTYTARLAERILWDLHEDRDVYNEMWQIPVVPMPKERQVATRFTRFPFSGSEAIAKAPLDEVVMDVVGPLKLGADGAEYFLTIVDVYTRMTWVYVLSKKSDVAEMVKTDWLSMVERQQDRLVKSIRIDRGEEFLSKEFSLWPKKNGIRHSLTMPYSPAMNDIAEGANRTITETARPLLIEARLPDYFWPDAVRSEEFRFGACGAASGAEKWQRHHNEIFPCEMEEEEEEEVQQVSERALTLPSRATSAPRIRVTPQQRHASLQAPAAEEEGSGKRKVEPPNRLTYDALGKQDKTALAEAVMMVGDDEESDYEECAFVLFSPVKMPGEPANLKEALERSDAVEWKKVMESELKSIEENDTWESVELPEGRKAITSKWLFKIKSDADGKIERFKSRLPTTLRTLLAGAAIKGWVVKQMDVTTAFLNGIIEEDILLAQQVEFDDGSDRVLKLKKAFYGLKQAPRQWYLKLREVLEEIRFTPSTVDHSLFMLGEGEQRSFMVVYVDEILIFSPSSDLVKEVMLNLQDKFKCKALGDVNFYLGLDIERDVEKRSMRVHQQKYMEALAANFGKSEGHVATVRTL
ncbi:unnamed protein product [Closterium sp. NIES-53]